MAELVALGEDGRIKETWNRKSGLAFGHFCCSMYRLAIIYSVTDRWTDDSMMAIAAHTACAVRSAKTVQT